MGVIDQAYDRVKEIQNTYRGHLLPFQLGVMCATELKRKYSPAINPYRTRTQAQREWRKGYESILI